MHERKIFAFALISILAFSGLSAGAPSPAPNLSDADKLDRQVEELLNAGKYSQAIPLATQALHLREKTLGPEHGNAATSLNNLGRLYDDMGDYAKAEPLLQRALKIREKALGPEHAGTALSLNNLGLLYDHMGNYAKAEPLYQRALKINEKALGPEHPTTAKALNNLAALYRSMGDYAKAEPLFQRALKINEKALGPEHPGTALSLNNLGLLYKNMGEYAKAEPLYQRTLKICEKALGVDHPNTAMTLGNLAQVYDDMGDYAKAEPLDQRALKICEKALGPEHPYTATSLNNLAQLYYHMGEYAKAEPLYQRALKICEKTLGPEHAGTALSLNNLAGLYMQMGDYAKAEPFYQRALTIREKALGPEHPDTAASVNNLAQLYLRMGDYAKAEPLLQRALKIYEKALGPDHSHTAVALKNLAYLYAGMGDPKEALRLAAQARRAQEKNLSDILSFTSEQQRLAFQKTTNPYTLSATLGNAPELAETVLRQKGVVLDSLLEDRLVAEASGDVKQREIVEQLRVAKQRLTQLQLEVPKDLSDQAQKQRAAEKEKLSAEVDQLEGGLARQVAGLGHARRALNVTVQQVQSALPQQAALIELLRYGHSLGKDKFEPRYGAVVIGVSGAPGWVPLGNAAEIEKNVGLYQKSVRGKTDEATLSSVLKALNSQVWAPIEKALPNDTKTVIISPDAELSFVSFATLLTSDDRFVGEKYSVRYVASGRDLLREAKTPTGPKTTMRVFANPDFGGIAAGPRLEQSNTVALRSVEMRDLQGISLPSLPGTEKEAAELEARAKKLNWQPQTYLGPNATKAELRQVNSPRILHLATHGFFLPEIDLGAPSSGLAPTAAEIPKGKLVNPMHRSGLALAGAQRTLQAWAKGEVPPIENDGIVTAEDVGGLKLDSTWLVVLSACDTGGGEARAGEGVMGLRRGFVQAGAQNLLMTLWPISDETTVQMMLDFYDAAFKSGNAPQALADTERDWLVKLRKERGLLDAVRLAGPFIMSSQGKQLPASISEIPKSPTPASTVAPNVPHGATMKGVDVNLPTGQSGETWALSDYVSVSVDKDGHYFFDKDEVTDEELMSRLRKVHDSAPEAKVFVRGDRDSVHLNVTHALDIIRSAGFYKISFEIKSEAAKAVPAPKGTETMAVMGIRVNLPVAIAPPPNQPKDYVSIQVRAGNQVYFDGQLVSDDQVLPRLFQLHQADPGIKVSISAEILALHGDVITVLDKVRNAGITKVGYQIRAVPPQGVAKDEVKEVAGRPGTMSISEAKALAIYAPKPEYTYEMRSQHITGSGVCVVSVDASGTVTDATMAQSIGNPILDNSAVSAFKRWRFKPGAVTKVKVPITFTMSGASY